MEIKIPKVDMGTKIRKCLNEQKRTVAWLADEINHDQSNLNKQIKKQHQHPILLFKISQALNIDLFAYYSKELIRI